MSCRRDLLVVHLQEQQQHKQEQHYLPCLRRTAEMG
jgi:hypothetical protein